MDPVSEAWAPDTIFDALGDGLARCILVAASDRSVSAEELAETCEASQPTVYRRIGGLQDLDLLAAGKRVRSDGNHVTEYETVVRGLAVEVDGDGIHADVRPRRDLPARFEAS